MAVTCDRCEANVPNNATFCNRCGLKIPTLRCYSCGEAIYPREDNCSACGMLQPHAVRQPPIQAHYPSPPPPPVRPPPPPTPPVAPPKAPKAKSESGCGCLILILILAAVGWMKSREGQQWLQKQGIFKTKPVTPKGVDWTKRPIPTFSKTPPPTILGTRPVYITEASVGREADRVRLNLELTADGPGQVLVAAYLQEYGTGAMVPAADNAFRGTDGALTAWKVVNLAVAGRQSFSWDVPYSALPPRNRNQPCTVYLVLYGTDGNEWSRTQREFPAQIQYRFR